MPWLDINQERHHAYAGYVGMVELIHEIDKALTNPIWQQVRKPAPWDEITWNQVADTAIADEAAMLAANPQRAREAERRLRICNCNNIDAGTIEDAIRVNRFTRVDEVIESTHAGRSCGSCGPKIESILLRLGQAKAAAVRPAIAGQPGAPAYPSVSAA
jgi:nitrogenase molybdenum-cofactor synthesis protein NifE